MIVTQFIEFLDLHVNMKIIMVKNLIYRLNLRQILKFIVKNKQTSYLTLIGLIMLYATSMWNATTKTNLRRLQTTLNKALRQALNKWNPQTRNYY